MFRACEPDSLGFVKKDTFARKLADAFALSIDEAMTLLLMPTATATATAAASSEIHIQQAMHLVDRVDKHAEVRALMNVLLC